VYRSSALLIWFAENLGTFTRAWIYPAQHRAWRMMSPEKIGSWLLLMIISYVMVSALYRCAMPDAADRQRG
jgi:uncharacterized membrane protein YoaT (DUF817 family)